MSNTNPSSASRSPSPPHQQHQQDQHQQDQEPQHRLKVHTHHCRFCNHLLLATTRTLDTLPRRKPPAKDNALILPLPSADDDDDADEELDEELDEPEINLPQNQNQPSQTEGQEQGQGKSGKRRQKHTTILLSTTLPDRKASLIRREDGFERRRFVRCGRCRVVVGYFLDAVHFPVTTTATQNGREDGGEDEEEPRAVYLLPGALMETEDMGDEEKMRVMDREWSGWIQ